MSFTNKLPHNLVPFALIETVEDGIHSFLFRHGLSMDVDPDGTITYYVNTREVLRTDFEDQLLRQ